MRTFPLLFLLLFLVSCGEAEVDTTDDVVADVEADVAATTAAAQAEATNFLTTTMGAIRDAGGDLTALPLTAASNNINGWMTKLSAMDGTEEVVEELASLKKELMQPEVDGNAVSAILNELAEETREFGAERPALNGFASMLEAAAEKLDGR